MQKEKKKFYQAKWFLWIWLIFFPPIGLIILWTCHKEMKMKSRVILSVVFALWFGILMIGANGGSTEQNTNQSHIYDNAQIKDVMNGSRTERIGEYSIIKISSEDITEENLTDWYFNYVIKNDFNWCMVLYTNKEDNTGIYSISGVVQKDVPFIEDEYGDYSLGDSSKGIVYGPTDKGKLEKLKFEE
ncbi:hypothetical protein [Lacrimispora brassicae]